MEKKEVKEVKGKKKTGRRKKKWGKKISVILEEALDGEEEEEEGDEAARARASARRIPVGVRLVPRACTLACLSRMCVRKQSEAVYFLRAARFLSEQNTVTPSASSPSPIFPYRSPRSTEQSLLVVIKWKFL